MKGKQVRAQSIGVWLLYEWMKREYEIKEDTAYNLSHSGDYVLCSVSTGQDTKVGCDIEEMKEPNLKIARRFFCPAEYEQIAGEKTGRCGRSIFTATGCLRRVLQKPQGKDWRLGWIPLRLLWGARRS